MAEVPMDPKSETISGSIPLIEGLLDVWGFGQPNSPLRIEKKSHIMFWLHNFEPSEIADALLILGKLQYKDNYLIRNAIESITAELLRILGPSLADTRFFPLGLSPSSSGSMFLYDYRKELGLSEKQFPTHSVDLATEPSALVFFDDVIGTGDQAIRFFKNHLNNLRVPLIYASVFAFQGGLNRIKSETTFTHVLSGITLSDEERAFTDNTAVFADLATRKRLRDLAEKYGRMLYPEHPLGYDDSQALLVFPHNTPNNTLPIIWASPKNEKAPGVIWKPIWERRKSVALASSVRDERQAGRSRGRLVEVQSRSIPAWNSEFLEWPGLQRGQLVAKVAPCPLNPDFTLLSAFDRLNEKRRRKGLLPHFPATRFRLIGPPRPIATVVALNVAPMQFVMRALLYDSDVPDEIKARVHEKIESAAKKVAKSRRNSHSHFNERSAIPLGVEIVLVTSDQKTLLRNRGKDVLTGALEWDISFGGYCGIDDLLPGRELDPFGTVENELKNEIGTIPADPRKIRLTGLHRNSKSGAVDLLGFWEVQIDSEHLAALLADKYPGSTKIFRTTKKAAEQYVWDTKNLIVDLDAGAIRAALGGTLSPKVLMPQGYTALDVALRAFQKDRL
jgi:hypothetical protein